MSYCERTVLAVVPARGGSKGIPRKNLQLLAGRSLVAHALELALSVPWIDRTVVSTEDEEIAREARSVGVEVPFLRPQELAGDLSKSIDVWHHAWAQAEEAYGERYDYGLLLEPTSPLRTVEDLDVTVGTLHRLGCKAAATVSRSPGHCTPQKTLSIDGDGRLESYLPTTEARTLRQLIPAYYHRNGICYAARRDTVLVDGTIVETDCAAVVIDRPVVNIDEPFDLRMAEWIWTVDR